MLSVLLFTTKFAVVGEKLPIFLLVLADFVAWSMDRSGWWCALRELLALYCHTAVPPHTIWPGIVVGGDVSGLKDLFTRWKSEINLSIRLQQATSITTNQWKMVHIYMFKTARRDEEFVNDVDRNAENRWQCQCPSKCYAPFGIFIFAAQHFFIAQQWKNENNQQEHWADVEPTNAPKESRLLAEHRFNIGRKSINTVEPKNARRFHKHHEEYG